jgi:hyperosmotically inducible periplasmic protein
MKKSATALAVTAAIVMSGTIAFAEYKDTDSTAPKPGMPRVDMDADKADPGERPQDYKADNSGRNQRDADGATVQPTDQSNNKADLEITQAVRKAVTADDSLSTNAQNVKIVTSGGVVTLRGPVKSEAEKSNIATKAKSVAGVSRVDNQLEIETP